MLSKYCPRSIIKALFPVAAMCSCMLTVMTRRFISVWSFADQFLESDFSTYKECRPLLIQCGRRIYWEELAAAQEE